MKRDPAPVHVFQTPTRALRARVGGVVVTATRSRSVDLGEQVMMHAALEEATAMVYQLQDLARHEVWIDGRPSPAAAMTRNALHLLDLRNDVKGLISQPFDSINLHIPREALRALADRSGGRHTDAMMVGADWSTHDSMVTGLMPALTALIEQPGQADVLVHEQLLSTLLTHLATRYGNLKLPDSMRPARIAPRQLRLACDLLAADLGRSISIAGIAEQIDISPAYFSRAFKGSTGMTPSAWLAHARVAAAKSLLRDGSMPLAEIALHTGFADQSHFTRVFTRLTGTTPGRWQRHARG